MRFLSRTLATAAIAALAAIALATAPALAGTGMPTPWQINLQGAATPVADFIHWFHDWLNIIIFAVTLFVLALLIWIMYRYNQRRNPIPSKTAHNTVIEVVWTIVPVIILVIIAIPSFKLLYYEAAIPPPDLTIKAIGKQWFWTYEYPAANFTYDSLGLSDADAAKAGKPRLLGVDNPIYVPVNKVVEIETAGADVIHSWAVPAFGVKMDAVPGRLNHTWFQATKTGRFHLFCSEYCGTDHSAMIGEVIVMTPEAYQEWLTRGADNSLAVKGRKLFQKLQCVACHTGDAQARAPSLEALYKRPVPLRDGGSVVADEDYLRESIRMPDAKIVAGFASPSIMPAASAMTFLLAPAISMPIRSGFV